MYELIAVYVRKRERENLNWMDTIVWGDMFVVPYCLIALRPWCLSGPTWAIRITRLGKATPPSPFFSPSPIDRLNINPVQPKTSRVQSVEKCMRLLPALVRSLSSSSRPLRRIESPKQLARRMAVLPDTYAGE